VNDDYDGTDVGVTARAKLALAASVGLTPAAIAIALGLLLGGCMTPQARGALYMGDHSGLAPTATGGRDRVPDVADLHHLPSAPVALRAPAS